ncbi:GntR family transcriptional regulator [Nonomuraea sp. NPDC050790]|uniref:GntR family transcriptional regulator n=1 Tax=Nonomuraea sp. NPDC050790 TaxID=3364371 RepID=UPI00379C1321
MTDHDERPLYQRIADELRTKIAAGELKPGDRVPSIPEMVSTYGVSDGVGRRVIRALEAEGLVEPRPGSGTYVRGRPKPRPLIRMFNLRLDSQGSPFRADMERQGHRAAWTYVSRTVVAPPDIRERLELGEAGKLEDVVRTGYVFTTDGEPSELSTSWEPLELTRGTPVVLPEDGPHVGVVDRMMSIGIQIDGCTEAVGARLGTAQECKELRVPPGSIMITNQRTYFAAGRPVETADIVVAAEKYVLIYGEKVRPRE